MITSEQIGELVKALTEAAKDFKPILKTKTVDFTFNNRRTHYKYAPLEAVIEATDPALRKNGLRIIQGTGYIASGKFGLFTRLAHTSGQWIEAFCPLSDPTSAKEQDAGAQQTYFKRYGWCAIIGVESESDTDAQKEPVQEKPKEKLYAPPSDETRLQYLSRIAKEKKIDAKRISQACEMYAGKPTLAKDLTSEQLEQVIKHIGVL